MGRITNPCIRLMSYPDFQLYKFAIICNLKIVYHSCLVLISKLTLMQFSNSMSIIDMYLN